jgi:hypothetical protein
MSDESFEQAIVSLRKVLAPEYWPLLGAIEWHYARLSARSKWRSISQWIRALSG